MRNAKRQDLIALERRADSLECWRSVMRSLSPVQQKIVMLIHELGEPPVKAIAQRGFLSQQTVSGELMLLKKLGLVRSVPGPKGRKRESLYSLCDDEFTQMLLLNDRVKAC